MKVFYPLLVLLFVVLGAASCAEPGLSTESPEVTDAAPPQVTTVRDVKQTPPAAEAVTEMPAPGKRPTEFSPPKVPPTTTLPPTLEPGVWPPPKTDPRQAALEDLASRLEIDIDTITWVSTSPDEFPAGGDLGCPQPGKTPLPQPAFVNGKTIILEALGTRYTYRARGSLVVFCGPW